MNRKELIDFEETIEIFRDDNYNSAGNVNEVPEPPVQEFRPMFEFGRQRALTPINGNVLGWPKKKKTESVCTGKQKVVVMKNTGKENLDCKKISRKAAATRCVKRKPAQRLENESEKVLAQDLEKPLGEITFQPTVSSTPLKSLPNIEKKDKVEADKVVKGKKYTKPPASIYPVCPIVLYD